jgi:hypothetical protein
VALINADRITLIGSVPELATQVLGDGYHVEFEADGQGLAETLAAVPGVRAVERLDRRPGKRSGRLPRRASIQAAKSVLFIP